MTKNIFLFFWYVYSPDSRYFLKIMIRIQKTQKKKLQKKEFSWEL